MSSNSCVSNGNIDESSLAKKLDLNQVILTELSCGFSDQNRHREVYEQISPGAVFVLQNRGELTKKIVCKQSQTQTQGDNNDD